MKYYVGQEILIIDHAGFYHSFQDGTRVTIIDVRTEGAWRNTPSEWAVEARSRNGATQVLRESDFKLVKPLQIKWI